MAKKWGFVVLGVFAAACGSQGGGGGTGGWTVVASSGSEILANPAFSGGLTNGQVSGSFGLSFLDVNTGWAVGNLGEILRTTNGGQSAVSIASPTSSILRCVVAMSSSEIWISGRDVTNDGSSVWRSTDGGANWTREVNTALGYPDRTGASLDRIQRFLVGPTGTVAAVGGLSGNVSLILGRDTNGTWWELYNAATTGRNDQLNGIAAVAGDPQRLIAVGNGGAILATGNGGSSWNVADSGTTEDLQKVACSGEACIAVGNNGVALRSTNGGGSWTSLATGTNQGLSAVAFSPSSSSAVWVGGYNGTILSSSDQGAHWRQQSSHTTYPIQDIFMVTAQIGWAAASNTASNTGALLATTSGGD